MKNHKFKGNIHVFDVKTCQNMKLSIPDTSKNYYRYYIDRTRDSDTFLILQSSLRRLDRAREGK